MLANDNLCFGIEQISKSDYLEKIRALNDNFRLSGRGGIIVMSICVQSLSLKLKDKIFHKIVEYEFSEDDKYDDFEHDMGFFEVGSLSVVWKIDCLDLGLVYYSPNPLDPKVTCRVLTVMLTSEI